jgi:hypothetical protein
MEKTRIKFEKPRKNWALPPLLGRGPSRSAHGARRILGFIVRRGWDDLVWLDLLDRPNYFLIVTITSRFFFKVLLLPILLVANINISKNTLICT